MSTLVLQNAYHYINVTEKREYAPSNSQAEKHGSLAASKQRQTPQTGL